ncbi:hypothetical protein FACS18949_09520 [Clostridia bacterium]|nr:hypothetical protein FACS18949_09520 [Clostridia bacterium]
MKINLKRLLSLAMAILMLTFVLAACANNSDSGDGGKPGSGDDKVATDVKDDAAEGDTINLWAFTNELPLAFDKYKEYYKTKNGKDFPYNVNVTQISDQDNQFINAIDPAFAGGDNVPDLYIAESAFVLKYTQGDFAKYAATYKSLGIDVEKEIKDAGIAPYTVEIGRRSSDGEVVGLGYQTNPIALIYRRSIAKDVWGTDDPAEVEKKVGPGIDKFFAAGEELKAKGYSLLSGSGDLWNAYKTIGTVEHGWVVDDKLDIPATFDKFFDYAKELKDKDLTNNSTQWGDAWFADMKDAGTRKVFAFMGPAWLINYTLGANSPDTSGDWALAAPPFPSWWGGSWTIVNKDTKFKKSLGEFIQWMTLDTSEQGFLYGWANGLYNEDGTKDYVSSSVVVDKSNGESAYLGGQDLLKAYVPLADKVAIKIANLGQYDGTIQGLFQEAFTAYANGEKDKASAVSEFKENVKAQLDIDAVDAE